MIKSTASADADFSRAVSHVQSTAGTRARGPFSAARVCSGAWRLSPERELHVTLPRPSVHAVRAGEDDAELYERHALRIQGVPQDDSRFDEDFEVIYTDAAGGEA